MNRRRVFALGSGGIGVAVVSVTTVERHEAFAAPKAHPHPTPVVASAAAPVGGPCTGSDLDLASLARADACEISARASMRRTPPKALAMQAAFASTTVRTATTVPVTVTFRNTSDAPIEFDVKSLRERTEETFLTFVPVDAKKNPWACANVTWMLGAVGGTPSRDVLGTSAKEPPEHWTHVVLLPHGKARLTGRFLAAGCRPDGAFGTKTEEKLPRGRYRVRVRTPLVWPLDAEHPEWEPEIPIVVVP